MPAVSARTQVQAARREYEQAAAAREAVGGSWTPLDQFVTYHHDAGTFFVGAFVAGLMLTGQNNKPTDRPTDPI